MHENEDFEIHIDVLCCRPDAFVSGGDTCSGKSTGRIYLHQIHDRCDRYVGNCDKGGRPGWRWSAADAGLLF